MIQVLAHDWLRSISPQYGSTLSGPELTDAIRARLGIPFVSEGEECRRCAKSLDPHLIHAQSCGCLQSTKDITKFEIVYIDQLMIQQPRLKQLASHHPVLSYALPTFFVLGLMAS